MEIIVAIDTINAVRTPIWAPAIDRVDLAPAVAPPEPPPVVHAHACTGFEPAACALDLSEAGIAAAAAMQDARMFRAAPRRRDR